MKSILALALLAALPAAACDCIGYCVCRPESKTVNLMAAAKICVPIDANFVADCLYFGGFAVSGTGGTATLPPTTLAVTLSTPAIKWDNKSSHAVLSYDKGIGFPVQLSWGSDLKLVNKFDATQMMAFTLSTNLPDNLIPAASSSGFVKFGGVLTIGANQPMGCYEKVVPITLKYVIPS